VVIKKLNAAGTKTADAGVLVYDGHDTDPTIEGPKLYKKNNYYYIFAPAGGVSTGWQLVLRSKNIYGPYERKVVMDQGSTKINGPHQGAWVTTQTGEDWFLHFQDKGAYGRVLHLQPMQWKNDWPVIGIDKDGDGKGEPVLNFKKPNTGNSSPVITPEETDEFNSTVLGSQWQWQANPKPFWSFCTGSALRLYSYQLPDSAKNYWDVPNILMQKFPAEEFTATAKVSFNPRLDEEKAGFTVMGTDYAYLCLIKKTDGIYLQYNTCQQADKGKAEEQQLIEKLTGGDTIYFRVKVAKGAVCHFSYSYDNEKFTDVGKTFVAQPGRWIGAKLGIFCTRTAKTNDSGFVEFDWFRIDK
jgi:beta-xylosidase